MGVPHNLLGTERSWPEGFGPIGNGRLVDQDPLQNGACSGAWGLAGT